MKPWMKPWIYRSLVTAMLAFGVMADSAPAGQVEGKDSEPPPRSLGFRPIEAPRINPSAWFQQVILPDDPRSASISEPGWALIKEVLSPHHRIAFYVCRFDLLGQERDPKTGRITRGAPPQGLPRVKVFACDLVGRPEGYSAVSIATVSDQVEAAAGRRFSVQLGAGTVSLGASAWAVRRYAPQMRLWRKGLVSLSGLMAGFLGSYEIQRALSPKEELVAMAVLDIEFLQRLRLEGRDFSVGYVPQAQVRELVGKTVFQVIARAEDLDPL